MTRHVFAATLAGATGIFAFAAGLGVSRSGIAAALLAAVAAGLTAFLLARSRRPAIDLSDTPRWLVVVSGVVTLLALAQLGRMTVFMVDPARTGWSFVPSSQWELQHSCLTAYHVATRAAVNLKDIYDDALYSVPGGDPAAMRTPLMLGTFKIDVFEYPPPFLLLPLALQNLTPEFLDLRMLWYALSGGVLILGLVAVAGRIGAAAGTRAILFAAFVCLTGTTLNTLQKGNVQLIIIAMAMLAMLLFDRRENAAGGAILAFAIAGKIYPGLLVVYLLARRQWSAVGWTAVWGVVYCALTLMAFGPTPYAGFLDHLPRLLSGEAFPAFRNPVAWAINLSIPGLLFKARLFGLEGATFDQARMVGSIYMLVAVAATLFAAWRARRDADQPLVWMAIILLATLRSPFLPAAYGTLPALWLLTLLAARRAPDGKRLAAAAAAWAILAVNWPIDWPIDRRGLALLSLAQMGIMVTLVVMTLRRATAPATIAAAMPTTERAAAPQGG